MNNSEVDDTRQSLCNRVKRCLRNPWFFRLLMLVWKLVDSLDRD